MAEVPPSTIPIALDKCDTRAFEKYAQTVFGAVMGNTFKPLGGHKDGGADGFVEPDIQEDDLHDRTTPAVRLMRPSMVWTPVPRRYGTPQRTHLRGLAPAMSRKQRCLTGLT
jgi:hypothetical protein